MDQKDYIKSLAYSLKEGQRITIDRRCFNDAFPCGFPSIYNDPKQAFLSSMIGSAWGVWRVDKNMETGDYTISRHKESNKRYYVDPDREHLFNRMADGTLEIKTPAD